MEFKIEFSEEKNILLQEIRGINFNQVIEAIIKGDVLDNIENKNYPKQKILPVKIKNYVYAVPYVINKKKKTIFLKTVYPSRVLTKKYYKKGEKMNKKIKLDAQEKRIEKALERGKYRSTPNLAETKKLFKQAAKNYQELNKTKRITIRVNNQDLIKV